MMIFTSYYGNIHNLPPNIIPISIAGKCPDNYNGIEYKRLAPKKWFFDEWKKNKDNEYYIKHFNQYVLNNLDPHHVYEDLCAIAKEFVDSMSKDDIRMQHKKLGIALICYEKPFEFCHRHLVRDWFQKNGIYCEEYSNN